MTTLIGIATHHESKGKIQTHETMMVNPLTGLDDYQGRKNEMTAITILSEKSWLDACHECQTEIPWIERRANLLVDDFTFSNEFIGEQFQLGEVLLEVTKETDPCLRMNALKPGLREALINDWRGGARCRVLRGGQIKLGDTLTHLKRI
jgi:MOSC domain-containing protein YiiM